MLVEMSRVIEYLEPTNMIKAIIFDADGMLVHGERFSSRLEKDFGISTEVTGEFFKNEFQDCLIGKADLKEELAKYVDKWGWDQGVDALVSYWFDDAHNVVDTQFQTLIHQLRERGVVCVLATNNEQYRVDYLSKDRGLENWLDGIYASSQIGYKKPAPKFFQGILDNLGGIDKEEVVYWDDDDKNLLGAKDFGFQAEKYTDIENFIAKNDL